MFSRNKARRQADELQETVFETGEDVYQHLRQAAGETCGYVKQNPWVGIGVSTLLGFLAAAWLNSKNGE